MQIIVLGMHRSGTSTVSRILNIMGMHFGPEGISTGYNEENEKGFWERKDIRALNDHLLLSNQSDWYQVSPYLANGPSAPSLIEFRSKAKKVIHDMDGHRPWFVKEPRMCVTMGEWRELFEVPLVVFVYRHPLEVAMSLQKRNRFPLDFGLGLWYEYNLSAIKKSSGIPCFNLDYNQLMSDPLKVIKGLSHFLSKYEVPHRAPSKRELDAFIDSNLYRQRVPQDWQFWLNEEQKGLYEAMRSDASIDSFESQMDETHFNHERVFRKYQRANGVDIDELEKALITKNDRIQLLQERTESKEAQIKKLDEARLRKDVAYLSLTQDRDRLNLQLHQAQKELKEKDTHLKEKDIHLKDKSNQLNVKEKQVKELGMLVEDMRLINRVKGLIGLRRGRTTSIGFYLRRLGFGFFGRILRLFFSGVRSFTRRLGAIWHSLIYVFTYVGKKRQRDRLLAQVGQMDRTQAKSQPLVSIIILNRDGLHHLKKLFKDFEAKTHYTAYEIIVFDNQSTDDSLAYLRALNNLPIRIIENQFNDSFSSANNKSAAEAKGELLLFLNNDIIPIHGWLNRLVKTHERHQKDVGLVGARLLYPLKWGEQASLKVQHEGIAFRTEQGFIRPYNVNNMADPSFDRIDDREVPSVTAACVLVDKSLFNQTEGFDEGYLYGYEDVDLGLKMRALGKKNIVAGGVYLFHSEFGTQQKQKDKEVAERRKSNIWLFRNKWYRELLEKSWEEKISGSTPFLTEERLTIGITVTEDGPGASAGDYFTAMELAEALEARGIDTKYLVKNGGDWYRVEKDVDVLLVLLHNYDLNQVKSKNPNLIKAAWMRNWFDQFIESSWFNQFDLVFSSSKQAGDLVREAVGKKSHYLPIATNQKRFGQVHDLKDERYKSDYCFTGSYWNAPREIMDFLHPDHLPEYDFHLYGKNWQSVPKFRKFFKGFLTYSEIPKVYANTKVLIDDANHVTKPWGSVNSRVFDAIMAGVLVITNGQLGAVDVFEGELPSYSSSDELENLLRHYLSNEEDRLKKVNSLQVLIEQNHTYDHRANQLLTILSTYYSQSVVIKVPAPKWEVVQEWGDYHFARSLKKEFEAKGYRTAIDILPEWDQLSSYSFRNVLVLRGLSVYEPRPFQQNMMWNISHPDKVTLNEYLKYDHVFVASKVWTNHLKNQGLRQVSTLMQCTDSEVFRIPEEAEKIVHQILFVGNSRKVMRRILKDLLPTHFDLAVYGTNWEDLIEAKYIKGNHISNEELYKHYHGAKVLLNDHWDDMREKGFISNRIFDGLASGATIVTDEVEGLEELFSGNVLRYNDRGHLNELIKKIFNGEIVIDAAAARATALEHTFEERVKTMLEFF